MLPAILLGAGRVVSTVASVAARAGTAAAEVGGTAARAGSAAAEVGSTAARVGSAASEAGGTVARAGSTASRVSTTARTLSRGASHATRNISDNVHDAANNAQSPGRGASYSPSSAEPSYGYGSPQRSPQFLNADPHYGVPTGPVHSGYSGLDNAEATTGTVIRRDPPPRPMPLNSSTISTMGRSMAWQAPSTLIGKGAQGSFFEFGGGGSQQGAPYRPQGG